MHTCTQYTPACNTHLHPIHTCTQYNVEYSVVLISILVWCFWSLLEPLVNIGQVFNTSLESAKGREDVEKGGSVNC